ncbi:HEAT repeat domain-containing protein [Gimesia fumaroli]|uniref:HEAT repeat protein n=1 Tax=Gimesia fumaroli TaxID=2527976 RepID=A0A518IF77_9PLAN|nr:HEAT repeat domain-containing protein [Gimesia fumaroli]QDV51753.1 HEAT repeat protein [Gimesia fumaroli]
MVRMSGSCCLFFCICFIASTTDALADDVNKLVALLQSDKPEVRYDAACSLKKIGAKAEPAIKPLIAALNDSGAPTEFDIQYFGPRVRDAASDALVRIGRAAVPALIEALSHKNKSTREMAARTLGELGPLAKNSFAALTRTLDDPEHWVQMNVVRAMVKVGVEPKVVVPILEKKFYRSQKTDFIRAEILESFYAADPQGTLVIPILVEGLKDSNGDVMAAAARTLEKFGPKGLLAVNELTKALPTTKVRWDSYADVGFTVPVRIDVVRALAGIGPDAVVAVPSLIRLMEKDKNERTRIWSSAALVRITPDKPSAKRGFTLLLQILQGKQGYQEEAAEALGTIGNEAAIKALIDALQVPDESEFGSFRQAVASALGEIGPPAKAAVPALRAVLLEKREWHFGVRRESAIALGKIGAASKPAIPDLISLSNSDDEYLRDVAAEAIEKIKKQSDGSDASDGVESKPSNKK